MSQWGRSRHRGIRHNQEVRGGGTWNEQDRRLKRHLHGRIRRKRGFMNTWSSQVRKLDRGPGKRFEWVASRIVLAGLAVFAVTSGGNVLVLAVIVVLAVLAWHKIRSFWN